MGTSPFMKNSSIVVLLFLLSFQGLGQYTDGGGWFGAGVSSKVNKRISWNAESQLRLNQGFTRYNTVLVDLGGRYKITKDLDFDLTYRFAHGQNDQLLYFLRHRIALDLRYEWDLGKPEIQFRVRYQAGQRGVPGSSEGISDLRDAFRYRAKIDRKLFRKTRGSASCELFQSTDLNDFQLTDYRLRFQVERNLPGPHEITIGYLFQEELFRANPLKEHILTLGYSVKI